MKSRFRQLAIERRPRTRQKPSVSKLQEMIARHPYGISLLAGGISATGFAPLNLWPLTLLMLALWMAILMQAQSRKAAFLAGWLFGLGHFIIGLNWIAKAFTFQAAMPGWMGYVAVVLLSLYLAVFPALAALVAWSLSRKRPWAFILGLAGTWIITEWLRSWVFSGFIWNPLSVTLPSGLWSGSAFVGTYGLAAVALIIAGLCLQIGSAAAGRRWRQMSIMAVPAIIIFALAVVFAPRSGDVNGTSEGFPITIVQPNIGQQDKWKAGYEQQNLSKLAELTVRKDDSPRILFWPEAAIPDYLETGYPVRYYYGRPPELVRQQLGALMKPGDVLVLGALKLEFDEAEGRAVGARNSVFAIDDQGEPLGRYDKSHLVPYGEYLPMRPLLSAIGLSRLVPGDFDFWPGPGARSLDLGKFGKAGLQVCYEIIFSGQVVDRDNRPDFIFNPSNDAWFGAWGPPQHLAQARLRAIEEGLPVIRSTPTGISALIDADGGIVASVPMGQAGRIDANLPRPKSPTVFARYGQILPLGLAIILLLSAIAIRVRAR
jgi:apolipoprotein N-acyltransferase